MDPVTTAIVAALTAAGAKGAGAVGERVLPDAYTALKGLLQRKFGVASPVAKAVEDVEAHADSKPHQQLLQANVQIAGADKDPEVLRAAQALLDEIKAQPGGERHIQQAIGSYIAQADRASTASVNVGRPEPGAPPKA